MRVETDYGYWATEEDGDSWSSPKFFPDASTAAEVALPRPEQGWSAVSLMKAVKGDKGPFAAAVRAALTQIKDQISAAKSEAGLGGKVYQYGISAIYDEELVVSQMLAGHRYQNELVAIERDRREKLIELQLPFLRAGLDERLAELEEQIDALRSEAKRANSRERSKQAGDKKALNAALRPLKEEKKGLFAERKQALKAIRESEELQAAFAECDREAEQKVRDARAATAAFWGTYLLAEAAVKAAKSKPELRFHRWDGSGTVAVQIQGGMTASEVFGDDSRVRIEPVDPVAWDDRAPRGDRRRACRTTLSLRVGSEGRDPVWARFRMHMHRPLPEGAQVKWVKVHRQRVGSGFRWLCDITVICKSDKPATVGPEAAIDWGWRLVPGGLRVATLVERDRQDPLMPLATEYFVLPQTILDRLRKVEDLQSIRKKSFNAQVLLLQAWLNERKELPEWILEATEHIHAWKAPGRLARVALEWREKRFDGDAEAYERLEAWRKQDKHLWDWEANLRDKVLRRRREIYRGWAKRICERYQRISVEKLDLREFDRLKPVEMDDGSDAGARKYRRDAALSVLRLALKDAAAARKVEIVERDPAWTTRACSACGVVDETWDPASQIRHRCPACGVDWDQDVNAAINLLNAGLAPETPEALATV